jgi:two-component system LytT family sensor kinase
MNKTAIYFLSHSLAWVVLFFLGLVIAFNSIAFTDTPSLIVTASIFTVWLIVSFYVFYYKLVPDYLAKSKYKTFTLYACLTVFIIIPVDLLLWYGIFYSSVGEFPTVNINIIHPYVASVLGAIISGGLGTFYRFGSDWFKSQQIKKDLENKHLLSELRTLKSKLNPHLLFNTLNNIDTLIQTSPEQASEALSKLSDILRYVVYETENETVSIQKEIDNLQKYIALEKIRIVNPDAVQFVSDVNENTTIPPMLFFPFVENGFKHSNLNQPDHKLKISITEAQGKLVFSCLNTINTYRSADEASGMGLELARKRLVLLFPDTHVLTISDDGHTFKVNLEIQIN